MARPVALAGKPLPFEQLSPEEFQDFVYVALGTIGPRHGFRVDQLTGQTGDGGFDAFGKRVADGRVVCLQAKRWKTVSVPDVALELAKVALTSSLEGTTPAEHYFVCAGTVRDVLNVALRDTARQDLRAKATAAAAAHDDLKALRARVAAAGGDPRTIADQYVTQLDRLVVWSGRAFDRELSPVWSALGDAVARHFAVERVLVEHPRPDFDEAAYLERVPVIDARPLRASPTVVPPNVRLASAGAPLANPANPRTGEDVPDVRDAVLALSPGQLVVLVGPGGAGKSTVISTVLQRGARTRASDAGSPLPIAVSLGAYRVSLRTLIEEELGIRGGHWQSIPGPFLLLLDGLNELSGQQAAAVLTELATIMRTSDAAAVVTMRSTGLPSPIVFPRLDQVFALQPLTFQDARSLANSRLQVGPAATFVTELRKRFNFGGASFFALPFGVAMMLQSFATKGCLPTSTRELIGDILQRRFDKNDEALAKQAPPKTLPRTTLDGLSRAVAVELRLIRGLTLATRGEVETTVHAAVIKLREEQAFGADAVADAAALEALVAYEVLVVAKRDMFRFEHELVAGLLVSERLAQEWRSRLIFLRERSLDESWLFAVGHVDPPEREALLKELCNVDPVLAARAALECQDGARLVEPLLLALQASSRDLSAVSRWDAYTAMAVLSSPTCIARLNQTARTEPPRSDDHDHATRALCLAGDRETLLQVLDEADRMQSAPGLRMSGGAIAWWQSAPADVALELAREWVDGRTQSSLSASLRTIARYGDKSDVPRLLRVLESTPDIHTALRAYHACAEFEEAPAREVLLARTRTSSADIRMLACHALGVAADDAPWLLEVALTQGQLTDGQARMLAEDAATLLGQLERVPEDLNKAVRDAYPGATLPLRHVLWSIATKANVVSFESLAVDAIRSPTTGEVGHAANFAAAHDWQDSALHDVFLALAREAVSNSALAYTWDGWRVIAFLLARGDRELVARVLDRSLQALLNASDELRAGGRPTLTLGDGRTLLEGNDPEKAKFSIGWSVGTVLREAAAVADLLPARLGLRLLGVDLLNMDSRDALIELLRSAEPAQTDVALMNIADEVRRVEAVCMLVALGATETRLNIIAGGFERFLDLPFLMNRLVDAARLVWSDALLARITRAVVAGWGEGDRRGLREHYLSQLASMVTRRQAREIVAPALAQAGGARGILVFWCEVANKQPAEKEARGDGAGAAGQ